MTWVSRPSDLDPSGGYGTGVCWATGLGLFIATGAPAVVGASATLVTSPDGETWTARATPFVEAWNVIWNPFFGTAIALGQNAARTKLFANSADGVTWTDRGSPYGSPPTAGPIAIAVKPSTGLCLIGMGVANPPLVKTTDGGVTYSTLSGWPSGTTIFGIAYSPTHNRWVAIGSNPSTGNGLLCYSNDDGASWSVIPDMDGDFLDPGDWSDVYWDALNGQFWLTTRSVSGHVLYKSPDGTPGTWTAVTTSPLEGGRNATSAIVNCDGSGSLIALGGFTYHVAGKEMCVSQDGGATFVQDSTPGPFGDNGYPTGLAYSPSLNLAVAAGIGFTTASICSGLPTPGVGGQKFSVILV